MADITTITKGNEGWMRALMIGSFAGAAVLFFTDKRPAAFALAGVGMATLAAEHPEKFEEIWNNAPEYLEKGTRFVNGVGQFVEKLAEQGYRFQQMRQGGQGTPHYRV